VTERSFDSGASAWQRFSARSSALYVPVLLAAAQVTAGQRVLDVATGAGPAAVEAATLTGSWGFVLGRTSPSPCWSERSVTLVGSQ
jgi:hypothetical protein